MALYEEYVNRSEFSSYEDMKANLRINIPEDFNFAYDVVDRRAQRKPDARAMV